MEKYGAAERKRREGVHHERPESLRKLMEEHDKDEGILLPGQIRRMFEGRGHSVNWWQFEELYGDVRGAVLLLRYWTSQHVAIRRILNKPKVPRNATSPSRFQEHWKQQCFCRLPPDSQLQHPCQ